MARRRCVVDVDLADVWETPTRTTLLKTLTWGDEVTVLETTDEHLRVESTRRRPAGGSFTYETVEGYIVPRQVPEGGVGAVVVPRADNRVLRVNFVDVQQGDAAVIETPKGKILLIDGGENIMFARYLASRFRGTSTDAPKVVDAVIVTHGDADHFAGLAEIGRSESHENPSKRLFMATKRVYHNGLVKRPGTRDKVRTKEADLLGPTVTKGRRKFLTGLVENLLTVDEAEMNAPFRSWRGVLDLWNRRQEITFTALSDGDKAFRWLGEDLTMEVLGPIRTTLDDGTPALPGLGRPKVDLAGRPGRPTGFSASHTINGHSIVLRLVYGDFSFLFTGDLNEEAGAALVERGRTGGLRSDVLKVPHHGSADFSDDLLATISPVVSIVSSGDENARKEYIHPRANLMGALGRSSRIPRPLIFVTELVAFFAAEGDARLADPVADQQRGGFFGFSRAAYGAVKTRTDGTRLLVCTDSAIPELKEAYAFTLVDGEVQPAPVRRV